MSYCPTLSCPISVDGCLFNLALDRTPSKLHSMETLDTPTKVTISEASRLVKKTRQTLYTHNKNGKLSFTEMEDGSPAVSITELIRVYGKLKIRVPNETDTDSVKKSENRQSLTGKKPKLDKGLEVEIKRIKEELDKEKAERLRERHQFEDTVTDLQKQRDGWQEQAKAITRQLEHLKPVEQPKRRLFGLLPPK